MSERENRDTIGIGMAHLIASRATCLRLKVGCIIMKDGRPISSGYNGVLPDQEHCNSFNCSTNTACERTVHAEVNAIAFTAKNGISVEGCTLYITHSPCENCARLIIQSGIIKVVYDNEYRLKDGILLLRKFNIKTDFIKLNATHI